MAENTTTLNVPVSLTSQDWRDEFKRASAHLNSGFGAAGWGEILLIGDRIVVMDVTAGAEERLRDALEELVAKAHKSAEQVVAMRNAAREEQKRLLLNRERNALAMQARFRSF